MKRQRLAFAAASSIAVGPRPPAALSSSRTPEPACRSGSTIGRPVDALPQFDRWPTSHHQPTDGCSVTDTLRFGSPAPRELGALALGSEGLSSFVRPVHHEGSVHCRDVQPVVPPNAVPFGSSVLLKPPTALDLREFFSTSKTVAGVPVGFAGQRAGKLVRHAAVHRARCELARRATHRLFR